MSVAHERELQNAVSDGCWWCEDRNAGRPLKVIKDGFGTMRVVCREHAGDFWRRGAWLPEPEPSEP